MSPAGQPVDPVPLKARIRELADPRTPWQRALWGVGSIVALREVVESVNATWDSILTHEGAMNDFKRGARAQLLRDPGLGDQTRRDRMASQISDLKPTPSNEGRSSLARLEQMIVRGEQTYLSNWSRALEDGDVESPDLEFAARAITSHLLDQGYHQEHVLGWLDSRLDSLDMAALVRESSGLGAERRWTFLLGVTRIQNSTRSAIDGDTAVPADEFAAALAGAENAAEFYGASSRVVLGLRVAVTALDPFSALEAAWERAKRLASRASLGAGQSVIDYAPVAIEVSEARSKAWAIGDNRAVTVPALRYLKLARSFDSPLGIQIEDALSMLSPHLQSTSGVSVAALWAATEGLVGRVDSNGHSAADRAADIATSSFPRTEAHLLMQNWQRVGHGDLQSKLLSGAKPYFRMRTLMDHFSAHGDPGFPETTDQVAVVRLQRLEASPHEEMKRVRTYMRAAFRRLYYQRNFVMHAAKFDSVSIQATSRVSPPLVAAAIDQIVNGLFAKVSTQPLELAARAENELDLLQHGGRKDILALLA
jgi:hypothetical protein